MGSLRGKLEAEEAKVARPYTEFDLLDSPEFKDLLTRKIALDLQKKKVEAELKDIGPEIEAMMAACETTKVAAWDGWEICRRNGSSPSTIQATKLLELGVGLDVIEAATKEGSPYTFIMAVNPAADKVKREEAKAAKGGKRG